MGFQRCKGETETVLAAVSRLCRATTSGGGPLSLCVCICTRVGAALQVVCFVGTLEKLGWLIRVWDGMNLGSIPNEYDHPKIQMMKRCSTILPEPCIFKDFGGVFGHSNEN